MGASRADNWWDRTLGVTSVAAGIGSLAPSAIGGAIGTSSLYGTGAATALGGAGATGAAGAATAIGSMSAVLGAGLAGYGIGTGINELGEVGANTGWFGQDEYTGQNRSASGAVVDGAVAADRWVDDFTGSDLAGDIVGGATAIGGSILAAPVSIASGAVSLGGSAISAIASW